MLQVARKEQMEYIYVIIGLGQQCPDDPEPYSHTEK
jgi:hypothetical protein